MQLVASCLRCAMVYKVCSWESQYAGGGGLTHVCLVAASAGLQIGWSKVQELRRYIKMFRDSGKYTICYMKVMQLLGLYLISQLHQPWRALQTDCFSTAQESTFTHTAGG